MSDMQNCPDCGAPVPADAPLGACPGCLLEAGLDSVDTTGLPDGEELAAAFPELDVMKLLGRGGMGAVYQARQRELDRVVALKVLILQDPSKAAAFASRFRREARALARLDHPNIVRVYEFGERSGMYFLLMDYVDGVNLREAMQAGEMEPRQALTIVPQICDALQYAHDNGVVHRDIKPENVLLSKSGEVKVADFGLAKLVASSAEDATLTRAGQVMGTLHYMAPEQIESPSAVDHRADIYSLGVVLYEMLTGDLPLGRFAPPSQRVRLDARLDEVVLRALEKKRERRYQAVSDVKTAVSAISDPGDGAPLRGATPPPFPRSAPSVGGYSLPALLSLAALPVGVMLGGIAATIVFWSVGSAQGAHLTGANALALIAFTGMAFGIVGWRQTGPGSPLKGRWMAVAGTLLPLVWVPTVIGMTYYGFEVPNFEYQAQMRAQKRWEDNQRRIRLAQEESRRLSEAGQMFPSHMPSSMRTPRWDDPSIEITDGSGYPVAKAGGRKLVNRMRHLLGSAAALPEQISERRKAAAALLATKEAESMTRIEDAELERTLSAGRYGLAFYDSPKTLQRFALAEIHLDYMMYIRPAGGTAVVRYEDHELSFGFEWEAKRNDWFLTTEPVSLLLREPAAIADPVSVFTADGTGITGAHNAAYVREIQMLFDIFASRTKSSDVVDEDEAIEFYSAGSREEIDALSPEERKTRIDRESLGLPLEFVRSNDPRLQGLEVKEIRFTTVAQDAAIVTVAGDRGEVSFPVSFDPTNEWGFGVGRIAVDLMPFDFGGDD